MPSKRAPTSLPPGSQALTQCLCPSARPSVSLLLPVAGQWKAVAGLGWSRPALALPRPLPVRRSLCSPRARAGLSVVLSACCVCLCMRVCLSLAHPPTLPLCVQVTMPCGGRRGARWGAPSSLLHSGGGLTFKEMLSPKHRAFRGGNPGSAAAAEGRSFPVSATGRLATAHQTQSPCSAGGIRGPLLPRVLTQATPSPWSCPAEVTSAEAGPGVLWLPHSAAPQPSPCPVLSAYVPTRRVWSAWPQQAPRHSQGRSAAARLTGPYFAHRWAALWQREVLQPVGVPRCGPHGA